MGWDTIHCQDEGYQWFCDTHKFCTFFKKFAYWKTTYADAMLDSSHYPVGNHSVNTPLNFSMAPLWHFWQIILSYFQCKRTMRFFAENVSIVVWSVHWTHRFEQFPAILEQQIIEKWAKMGFAQNIFANTLLYTCTQSIILKTRIPCNLMPRYKRNNLEFIFIGSEGTTHTMLNTTFTLWFIALHPLTQRKNCDDFWLGVSKYIGIPKSMPINSRMMLFCLPRISRFGFRIY